MRVYDQVKDMMCDELAQIARQPLNMSNLETAYKAVDIIKDIHTIEAMEGLTGGNGYSYNGNFFGNSYAGNMMAGGDGYSGMYPVMRGYSFEQGRGQYAQRDSQGRYMDGYSREGNSMNGGYYAGGSSTKEELKKLMEHATNETEKEAIRVAIESMNN